ncbi:MAG: S9 family peptidase [Ignavibacteriales bacterium]|nr:S9 family peptidase [Ignavibacteriales bacterium]
MKQLKVFFLLILVLLYSQTLFAQTEDKSLLSVDRIFNSRDFSGELFGQSRWIDDGKFYTTLEPSKDTLGGRDIVKYETESGKKEIMVSAKLLIPEGETKPLGISNYIWSPSRNMLMIYTNTARVWRQNTKGDYWVLDLKTNKLHKLGGDAKPSTLMFAKFSPDEEKIGYVREHNVYAENLSDGKITQLTFDGSTTIINGTFDWVYEEELDLRDGFRWSPDSKSIAYWQLDASGVKDFLLINDTDSLYSFVKPVQYPKVGTTNSACKVGVVSASGGETVWMKIPGDPRNNYIARMDWAASSDEIVLQHLNRKQNQNEVMLGNSKTGEVKIIFTETDAAWIDINDDLNWLKNGEEFTWVSERDGWRHIYLISRDGKNTKLLTPGNYDVIDVQSVDEKDGWIYFMGSPGNAAQRYLFRVSMDGKGKIERITPNEFNGSNSYQISDGANYAIHSYSNFDTPSITNLISLPDHKVIRKLVENKQLKEKITALKRLQTEFFKIDIGNGVVLDGWMMKPYNFDPTKKYPVLFNVYTEPAGQTVVDRWGGGGYLWHLMFAQEGYIIMSVDNRGTPAPRGREWRKSIYKKIGVLNSGDQAAAVKSLLEKNSFMDADRIGVWGWSGGGSATLNAMFRYPDIYKTGMAVAPVGHEKLYDTIYQERYMGLISENPEVYEEGSPVNYAKNLKGNLLIVHGTGDDNVHYQGTELVINELVKNNKPFTMMAYPNRTHGIYEGQGTTLHLYNLLTRYLHTNLPAGVR